MSDFDDAVQIEQSNRPPYTNSRIKVSGYKDPSTAYLEFLPFPFQ